MNVWRIKSKGKMNHILAAHGLAHKKTESTFGRIFSEHKNCSRNPAEVKMVLRLYDVPVLSSYTGKGDYSLHQYIVHF